MSFRVIIFSPDKLRGAIIREILQRSGFKALLLNRAIKAKQAIAEYGPPVVIFDTKDCLTDEISLLTNFFRSLQGTQIIMLGNPSVIEMLGGPGIQQNLSLTDPLDPELIVSKVKEALSDDATRKAIEGKELEADLKQFLRLA